MRWGRLLAVLAALLVAAGRAGAERVITLSFTGDCTLGGEDNSRRQADSLDSVAEREGFDYFFANFRDMFSTDDCTVINLEGVLSDSDRNAASGKNFRLRGPQQFVQILSNASVEAAGLANDHISDYGPRGVEETRETLEGAGIGWARATDSYLFEKDGIRISFYAIDYAIANKYGAEIRKQITETKESGEVNAVVVLFHNGTDFAPRHTELQEQIGNQYIDAGADLVIMHHPHVVQGIQIHNSRSVFYSLGNFVYGGSRTVRTEITGKSNRQTTNLHALVVQVRMHFSDEGSYRGQQAVLIPIYTTSSEPANDYQPRRMTPQEAEPVLGAVQYDTQMELPAITEDEDGYARVIMPYLSAGTEENPGSGGGAPEKPAERPWR